MNRRIELLSTVAVMIASSPTFAQFGGMGSGSGTAVGMMGGGFGGGPAAAGIQRSVQIEMEGGNRLSGVIDLRPIIVDGDLGQYAIEPDKIKMIRFLKPEGDADADGDGGGGDAARAAVAKAGNRGGPVMRARRVVGGGNAVNFGYGFVVLTRGKVVTTTDKEIIGTIHIPTDFRLELEYGSLNLAPAKLRSITITDAKAQAKLGPADAPDIQAPAAAGEVVAAESRGLPRYFRQGNSLILISPVGDRVTLFDLVTKKSQSLALSGSKDSPLEVTPFPSEQIIALILRGSNITRIAVADTSSGTWHSQDLRTPIKGQAAPIVAPGVVVYHLGQDVYAYGALAQRWGVAELPKGVRAMPVVANGTATIESYGHIYTFAGKSGKWEHIDVRAILLDGGGAAK